MLKSIPGVEVSDVKIGSANVQLDTARTSGAAIAAAVSSAGFPATVAAAAAEPSAGGGGYVSGCGCGPK